MKRILSVFTIAAVMAASCNSSPGVIASASTAAAPAQDTTGLAAFQAWKSMNELAAMNQQFNQPTVSYASAPQTRVVYVPQKSTVRRSTSSSGSASSSSSGNAKAAQKKGWSKAAKGAVIGGVAGAAGGAVINKKNRAVGAVIGGVLGAGAGYGIGRGMDKRDGRIEYTF